MRGVRELGSAHLLTAARGGSSHDGSHTTSQGTPHLPPRLIAMSAQLKRTITWFPGHMAKALRGVERILKQADLVLDVRDARASVVVT